jgi:hypothetical protein
MRDRRRGGWTVSIDRVLLVLTLLFQSLSLAVARHGVSQSDVTPQVVSN